MVPDGVLAKLVGFNDDQRAALEQIRTVVWELYRDLKAFKAMPTAKAGRALEKRFDEAPSAEPALHDLLVRIRLGGVRP